MLGNAREIATFIFKRNDFLLAFAKQCLLRIEVKINGLQQQQQHKIEEISKSFKMQTLLSK